MNNNTINADEIKATKLGEKSFNKMIVVDINDEKVKTKIQLAQKLKNKLILPARRKN